MAIDDELDARKSQYPEPTSNIGLDVSIKALTLLGGGIGIGATILDTLRSHFSTQAMMERITALLEGLESMVRRIEERSADTEARVSLVENRLKNDDFAQAFVTVANVAVFTPELERVRQFGSILGYEAASSDRKGWDEAAALVEDLSRLTEGDLQALRLMVRFQGDKIRERASDSEIHFVALAFKDVMGEVGRLGTAPNDFYSRALRLSGFGLAHPLNFNPSLFGPQDMGFGPSLRGRRLVSILDRGTHE